MVASAIFADTSPRADSTDLLIAHIGFPLLGFVLFYRAARGARVDIGQDQIVVRTFFWRKRICFTQLEEAHTTHIRGFIPIIRFRCPILYLRDGSTYVLSEFLSRSRTSVVDDLVGAINAQVQARDSG